MTRNSRAKKLLTWHKYSVYSLLKVTILFEQSNKCHCRLNKLAAVAYAVLCYSEHTRISKALSLLFAAQNLARGQMWCSVWGRSWKAWLKRRGKKAWEKGVYKGRVIVKASEEGVSQYGARTRRSVQRRSQRREGYKGYVGASKMKAGKNIPTEKKL